MSELSRDEITVLKKINALGRVTSEGLARELGDPYTAHDLSDYLKSLKGKTLLNRIQDNPPVYELAPLGLIAIGVLPESAKRIFSQVPSEKCFYFYTGLGPDKFTKMSACSLSDFKEKAKRVDARSLEFHIQRGDIVKWFSDVLNDRELAKEFEQLRASNLHGEELRTRITRLIDAHIQRLTHRRARL